MEIIRGSTPTIDCEIPSNIPLEDMTEIWLSIKQGGRLVVDRMLSDNSLQVEGQRIFCKLTQEETLALNTFEQGTCGIRMYDASSDTAYPQRTLEPVYVLPICKDGVIGDE